MKLEEFGEIIKDARRRIYTEDEYYVCHALSKAAIKILDARCTDIVLSFMAFCHDQGYKNDRRYGMFGDPEIQENQLERILALRKFQDYIVENEAYIWWAVV